MSLRLLFCEEGCFGFLFLGCGILKRIFYVWNLKEVCQVGEVSGSSSLLFLSSVFGGCWSGCCAL